MAFSQFSLNGEEGSCLSVYVSQGNPPSSANHQYASEEICDSDQEIVISGAAAGTWYVLVENELGGGTYTISADLSQLTLSTIAPQSQANSGTVTIMLTGAGFSSGDNAVLTADNGTAYYASSIVYRHGGLLEGTWDLTGIPVGLYDVAIVQDTTEVSLAAAFEVVSAAIPGELEVDLVLPSQLGRHATATIYVEYTNIGEVSMTAPVLMVFASDRAFLTLAQERVSNGFWTSATPEGFSDTIAILASGETPGLIHPGESKTVPIYYAGLQQPWDMQDNGIAFSTAVYYDNDEKIIDWDTQDLSIKPTYMQQSVWDELKDVFHAQIGDTWGDYVSALAQDAYALYTMGRSVTDVAKLFSYQLYQTMGYLELPQTKNRNDLATPGAGVPLAVVRSYQTNLEGRSAFGALGYGWSHLWEQRVEALDDGTVNIVSGGNQVRTFQPDTRGGYLWNAGGLRQPRGADGQPLYLRGDFWSHLHF